MRPTIYTFPGSFIPPTSGARIVWYKNDFFYFQPNPRETHNNTTPVVGTLLSSRLSRTQSFRGFAGNHFKIPRYAHVIVSLSVPDEQKSRGDVMDDNNNGKKRNTCWRVCRSKGGREHWKNCLRAYLLSVIRRDRDGKVQEHYGRAKKLLTRFDSVRSLRGDSDHRGFPLVLADTSLAV